MLNQHYVPYFYLKEFSLRKYSKQDQRNRLIKLNVFFKNNKTKSKKRADNIASEIGFYDNLSDEVLTIIENGISATFKNIIKKESLADLKDSKQKYNFSLFLVTQMGRTPVYKEKVVPSVTKNWKNNTISTQNNNKIFNNLLKNPQYLDIQVRNFLIKKWKLIKNNTNIPFWTSDNPVIWLPDVNKGYSKGIYAGGIFFLLSPKLCLCLYDTKEQEKFNYDTMESISTLNKILLHTAKNMIFSNKSFPKIIKNKNEWCIDWKN